METSKKVRVQLLKGEPVEYVLYKLDVKKRNALFGKFLDLTKYMANKSEDSNVLEYVKEGENILDFMTDALEKAIPAIDLNNVDGEVSDKLFEENVGFILGTTDSKN